MSTHSSFPQADQFVRPLRAIFVLSAGALGCMPEHALAQAVTVPGSLSYSGVSEVPVPGLGNLALILLALILFVSSFHAFHRQARNLSLWLLVGAGSALFMPWQSSFNQALAELVWIELANPEGGTVVLNADDQLFKNTSGVTLRITGIQAPVCQGGNLAASGNTPLGACQIGLLLQNEQICATNFPGCEPEQCIPSCAGKECGDDGCSGSCGSCAGTDICSSGTCIPAPN
ncbi:MAG: midcut-by-XrtH protein [Pseudomonadota bacterium]